MKTRSCKNCRYGFSISEKSMKTIDDKDRNYYCFLRYTRTKEEQTCSEYKSRKTRQ